MVLLFRLNSQPAKSLCSPTARPALTATQHNVLQLLGLPVRPHYLGSILRQSFHLSLCFPPCNLLFNSHLRALPQSILHTHPAQEGYVVELFQIISKLVHRLPSICCCWPCPATQYSDGLINGLNENAQVARCSICVKSHVSQEVCLCFVSLQFHLIAVWYYICNRPWQLPKGHPWFCSVLLCPLAHHCTMSCFTLRTQWQLPGCVNNKTFKASFASLSLKRHFSRVTQHHWPLS